MHYTQQPNKVTSKTNSALTVLYARLQGFITGPMLREEVGGWDAQYGDRLPGCVLLDLRDVAGYGSGTPRIARDWLVSADGRGVQRIAFVASSSVIRTIVRVVEPEVKAKMKCFANETAAIEWLERRPRARKRSNEGGEFQPSP